MKIAKVIGRVVCTQKHESFDRLKMLLIQQMDENMNEVGSPLVAADVVQAGEGDLVYYEAGKEGGFSLDMLSPCDATIIAIIDEIDGGES